MRPVFFGLFSLIFLGFCGAQQTSFQGRIDFDRQILSFHDSPPVQGTLYLLTGSAGLVKVVQPQPFIAEVEFVEGSWKGESKLVSQHVVLRFSGDGWKDIISEKKPRKNIETAIFPYRRFQAAVLPEGLSTLTGESVNAFKVLHIQILD